MKNKLIPVLAVLLSFNVGNCQSFFKKSVKSVYGMYGRHFTTKYVVDSGTNNLVGRKMNISWEAGLNLDYYFNKNLALRTGIAGHIHVISDITYGTTMIPPSVPYANPESKKKYTKGSEYRERISVGIPIKLLYRLVHTRKLEFIITGGSYINIYFPTRDEEIGTILIDVNSSGGYHTYRKYLIQREFDKKKIFSGPDFSKPFLEWQFDVEAVRKFKRKGAIVAGIKTHIGTTKLEKAEFIIWPEYSDYRSKGHFILNRSYIGIYAGYRFGSNLTK